MSDIIVYFNVNLKLLTKLINSAFVGEWTTYTWYGYCLSQQNVPHCQNVQIPEQKRPENFALFRQKKGSKFLCANRQRPVMRWTGIRTNAFTLFCSSQDNLRRRLWSWQHCCHVTSVVLLLLVARWRNENFALIASGYSFHFQKIPRKPPPPTVSFVLHLSSY